MNQSVIEKGETINTQTKVGSAVYYLTSAELKDLKRRCKMAKLSFHAIAARPKVAKQILSDDRLKGEAQ